MNGINDQNRKNNKKQSPGAFLAAVILMLIGLVNGGAETNGALIAVIVGIAIVVGVAAAVKKYKGAAGKGSSGANAASFAAPKPSFSAQKPQAARPAAAKPAMQRAAVPVQSSRGDRYVEQLNGFLKNGIIEREEYDFLIRRWTGKK